ncbi:putative ankyrin repeat protein RF_0381 [Saccostrea cucullata]|uniref:putative ankyrin repeat protein RF_0381 n=1 Tax=Saccostrea cuccullata TaxID=36930 RepID=UPI002ED49615
MNQACLDINPEIGCYVANGNCSKSLTSVGTPASTSPAAGSGVTIALSVVFGVIFCLLISVPISFISVKKIKKYRKKKTQRHQVSSSKKYKGTEKENIKLLENSAEKDDETNDEPNVPLHKKSFSEHSSARITDIKDERNTKADDLFAACKNGKTDACRYLINWFPDMLHQVNDSGWNAALHAAQGGNVEILELLAERGVDMTYKNKDGSNILHIACVNSKLEMCQHIIQHYPDMFHQVDYNGWNVALYAAQGGNVEVLKLLAQKGADMTNKNKDGSHIFHIACANSKSEMCQYIIQNYPDMLDQINDNGWNVTLFAAKEGNVEILELLEQNGVDLTYKNENGSNILHIACMQSKFEMCQYIIQHYPDMLHQVDYNGWNVALYAAQGGNVEVLQHLAQKGVDMTYKNKDSCNILHIACANSKSEMCQYIIKHYPDMLDQINDDGLNVALYAAKGGNVEILELLKQKHVDMTYKNKDGCNILHIACANSKLEMCQHIIEHYPDILNQVNDDGWNAALHAIQGGNVEILELLAQKGADMTYKNKDGSNILHIACANAKSEMCQYIIQHYPDMLNQVNYIEWNAVLFAAYGGNVEVLQLLALKGVDMTYTNKNGNNILHIACANAKSEMCQYIIQHYPDMLKQVDNDGLNAALYAAQGGNVEILELLTKKGVDLTCKTKDGGNILHIACVNSRLEMCQHIMQHYPDMLKQVDNNGWNAA